MFNILLDALPTEWNGYKIYADFRTGIQLTQISEDTELTDVEKLECMARVLFVDMPQSYEEVTECVTWFMNGWNFDKHTGGHSEKAMDFDQDQGRIYSAFMAQYHIDLNTSDMHFWQFMNLLSNLEECAFTRVIDIRTKKIEPKMCKEEKQSLLKFKKIFALKPIQSEEDRLAEEEATEIFLKQLGV